MVKNEDVKQEFDLFSEVWKMFKYLLPVSHREDAVYWEEAVRRVSEVIEKYPGEFGKALSLTILDELERRCRANENQNTGCQEIS